ncbi:MAG: hypothetical protein WC485_08775 [Opitutaceae bacterium]
MNLDRIIDEIASQADDFLAEASNRKEARAGVAELVNADYAALGAADRTAVIERVMAILDREGFFESDRAGGMSDNSAADE